jgi:hypothetical protein
VVPAVRLIFPILCLVVLALPAGGHADPPGRQMRAHETRYYTIHTDLTPEQAREVEIRMTRMAEEYARRTRDFGGTTPRRKLPFYLFAKAEDYYATGAPRESAGRFDGRVLLAVAEDFGPKTWHIVQHEGFHQFAMASINANLPPWVNEGLAEYFGEAVFTGDGFITGGIPQWRLERIRKRFEQNEFKSLREMMGLSISAWNSQLSLANYDQAWAMTQFLAHGDNGRYQRAFSAFLAHLGRGQSWQVAWKNTFGDTRGFEEVWREWWLDLPDHPTADLYAQAATATLTSFLARATSRQQAFDGIEAFVRAGAAGEIAHHPADWLPPRLLRETLDSARKLTIAGATFSLATPANEKLPQVICLLQDNTRITGRFTLRQGRVATVTTTVDRPNSPE